MEPERRGRGWGRGGCGGRDARQGGMLFWVASGGGAMAAATMTELEDGTSLGVRKGIAHQSLLGARCFSDVY